MKSERILLEVKNTRDSEVSPLGMEQVFSALGSGHRGGIVRKIFRKNPDNVISLELIAVNSRIHQFIQIPKIAHTYIESQMAAQYPKISLLESGDYLPLFLNHPHTVAQLVLTNAFYYPLKTYEDLSEIDILSSVFGQMAKLTGKQSVAVQVVAWPAGQSWQRKAKRIIQKGVTDPQNTERTEKHPESALIEKKIVQVGFHAVIRMLVVGENKKEAKTIMESLAGSYGVYTQGDGNGLRINTVWPVFEERFIMQMKLRSKVLFPRQQILGAKELASLWHPPGLQLALIKNITWGSTLTGEAPENLPVATSIDEEKKDINFFAKTEHKNKQTIYGIKKTDRRKHLYVVGKTGTGKSTMIANMAINDIRNGEGVAVIDPHGDLCDVILDFIPSHRINDVAYLDPSDIEHPFHINPLEVKNTAYKELVSSGIVSIFYKLYAHSWGPRLEYVLRNTILTLLTVPNATLLQVPELLANETFRARIVNSLSDDVLKNFWVNEFEQMSPKMKSEVISPILNKVGQFLSSLTIRQIVGKPNSTIDLEEMMNKGKIVLVNLSQGKLGEDNSALLGAMMITKMQLAAMNRVYIEEKERRDFYLYVDEFQNFATTSFIKILSEARKYRLNLMLANQYIGQIEEDVQKAIFGNCGSLVSFSVGAQDAHILSREFGQKYKEEELVALGNYQIINKLTIDNYTSLPFFATTLPLPKNKNQNREKIIRSSRERYTKPQKP